MKKYIALFCIMLLFTGCSKETVDQEEKSEYLAYKSELVQNEEFLSSEDLNCDITVTVERVNDEIISYTTVVSNPREDMNSIKMMVVHNYFTEDVFPTVGVFEEGKDLLVGGDDKITLVGYIDTEKDIQELELELKIWIEYLDKDGNVQDIYYKTTK